MIKAHVRRYINEGNDVLTPKQFKDAMVSYGGINGERVALVKLKEEHSTAPEGKIDGVSDLNNYAYEKRGLFTWKSYNIGQEKMPKKTRAEIQREYRKRKNEEGEEHKLRERERKRKAYIPVSHLDESALKKRRADQNARVQKHRKEKKEAQEKLQETASARLTQDRQTRRQSNDQAESDHLIVKLDFKKMKDKRNGTRKRVNKALCKAHRQIDKLEQDKKKLTNRAWMMEKRIQRSRKVNEKKKKEDNRPANTPRSKSSVELREAGLSPSTAHPVIKKKLIFANSVMQEVRESTSKEKKNKKIAPAILVGSKIIKKYRLLKQLRKETGLSKRSLQEKAKVSDSKMALIRKQLKEKVNVFLSRDDNSPMMPGKADFKKHEGQKFQKRYLNDYLDNTMITSDSFVFRGMFTSEHPSLMNSMRDDY
ncbi:hypothetical protein AC249_AIPGENE6471 [Exaiptasia diaphana]|nr:hypothetical protein AC249_AIPGENE6471 [Exaiptasia diaphana]